MRDWEIALDDMEDRLVEGWKALERGVVDIRSFKQPAGLGPMPVELRARAERVLEETRALRPPWSSAPRPSLAKW